jgi:hypothetical protein
MESKKNKRPKPYDEMSTTGAMTRVTDGPRPKPYDEMSTTGALSRSSDVTRSLRPIARPERQGATKEGLNPAKSSLRPMARPARKPTADQQELIDYVDDLKVRIASNVVNGTASSGSKRNDAHWQTSHHGRADARRRSRTPGWSCQEVQRRRHGPWCKARPDLWNKVQRYFLRSNGWLSAYKPLVVSRPRP